MGFGDFLSKAAKFAGNAIVAVASEVMSQGGTTITRNYLEQAKKLNLDSRQQDMIQNAERLNNRLSEHKRNQKDTSDNIKENKSKITELEKGIDSKEVDVWTLCSQLIEKKDFYRLGVFNGVKYIVFSDEGKTKNSLSEFVNNLENIELDADGIDKLLCDYLNGIIPENYIETIPKEFLNELRVLIDEYKDIRKSNEDKIRSISDENFSLEEKLSDAKEKVANTDSDLRPLLDEIKAFCRPLIEEQKERNARSRR